MITWVMKFSFASYYSIKLSSFCFQLLYIINFVNSAFHCWLNLNLLSFCRTFWRLSLNMISCIYIYIYIERERERQTDRQTDINSQVNFLTSLFNCDMISYIYIYIYIYIVDDRNRRWPEGSLFDSCYTEE